MVQFSDVPEISGTAVEQVTLQRWASENFTALEIVVQILECMHRVKYQEYWLPCDRVSDAGLESAVAKMIHIELPICRHIVDRYRNHSDGCFAHQTHYIQIAFVLFGGSQFVDRINCHNILVTTGHGFDHEAQQSRGDLASAVKPMTSPPAYSIRLDT